MSEPRLVVGAAIVRHGCVLAARRSSPPEAAGRWELPGGKVEPGESPETALVREIAEELGCAVTVDGWLDGESPIVPGFVLRVAVCRTDDDPAPIEHDRIRWLMPEELDDVDWLEPDRPFLAELRELLLDGERLEGGNVGGAVRIGSTVRRHTGRWTPAVHALLAHLHAAGLRAVPRVHGLDARGREILDHLPGEVVDVDREQLSEARLADLGRWTRELHVAQGGFEHPGPWRFPGTVRGSVIGHNDLAPYNACFVGEELSGVFDWDIAGPATVLMDLATLAWGGIPLFRDIGAEASAHRLRVLAAAYGGADALDILRAVGPRMQQSIDGIREALRRGDPTMANLAAVGEPERSERALAAFEARLPAVAELLGEHP